MAAAGTVAAESVLQRFLGELRALAADGPRQVGAAARGILQAAEQGVMPKQIDCVVVMNHLFAELRSGKETRGEAACGEPHRDSEPQCGFEEPEEVDTATREMMGKLRRRLGLPPGRVVSDESGRRVFVPGCDMRRRR